MDGGRRAAVRVCLKAKLIAVGEHAPAWGAQGFADYQKRLLHGLPLELVEVEPGGLRELHWHPNTNEWQYYIEGQARMGVFAASGQARTFDYVAGDVGYVPFATGHYVENTGSTTLRFLEMFRSDYYADLSLNQWMALTPQQLLQSHLRLDQQVINALRRDKAPIVPA